MPVRVETRVAGCLTSVCTACGAGSGVRPPQRVQRVGGAGRVSRANGEGRVQSASGEGRVQRVSGARCAGIYPVVLHQSTGLHGELEAHDAPCDEHAHDDAREPEAGGGRVAGNVKERVNVRDAASEDEEGSPDEALDAAHDSPQIRSREREHEVDQGNPDTIHPSLSRAAQQTKPRIAKKTKVKPL